MIELCSTCVPSPASVIDGISDDDSPTCAALASVVVCMTIMAVCAVVYFAVRCYFEERRLRLSARLCKCSPAALASALERGDLCRYDEVTSLILTESISAFFNTIMLVNRGGRSAWLCRPTWIRPLQRRGHAGPRPTSACPRPDGRRAPLARPWPATRLRPIGARLRRDRATGTGTVCTTWMVAGTEGTAAAGATDSRTIRFIRIAGPALGRPSL